MSNMKVYPSIFAFLAISVILVTTAAPDTGKNTYCEKKKGLVILIEFPYVTPKVDDYFVRDRFRQLDKYVREMSYGKV